MYYSIMSLSDLSIRIWELVIFVVIILVGIGFVMKMIPKAFLDGQQTLKLYQDAKAAQEKEQHSRGGH